jgi:hypothetical protein
MLSQTHVLNLFIRNSLNKLNFSHSPTLAFGVGATPEMATAITTANATLCHGTSTTYKVPAIGFKGSPLGIDIRKVIGTSTTPVINTGIAANVMGKSVAGKGLLKTPMSCFRQAFDAFCSKYKVSATELLATLDE